ncbi:hypothetical protein ASC84_12360 [Acinetobacter sp. Root1280]|nr:hypothetical protein ASC84_12360 [Acinetobacter sp. Root1280]
MINVKKREVNEEYDWYYEDTGRDYKLQHQINDIRNNFESISNWLYLGADANDQSFVKIGITTGDLRSRSYSSARPTYYLFCAFKFKYNLSRLEMESVEGDILTRMENIYCNRPNHANRLNHFESGRVSECFQPVDFYNFYKDLHMEILEYH